MGVIVHWGSRSGCEYRTPVFAIATADGYVFALAYGSRVDWLRNLHAAGGVELRVRGRTVDLSDPRILGSERGRDLPWVARLLFTSSGSASTWRQPRSADLWMRTRRRPACPSI
jgi:deazaflavin-dependent oxidoreductase (nitroreductase family)